MAGAFVAPGAAPDGCQRLAGGIPLDCRFAGHGCVAVPAHVAHARQAHLHQRLPLAQAVLVELQLHAERQVMALLGGLDGLGGELRDRGNEGDVGADRIVRRGVEHDARLRAQRDFPGHRLGQIDVHVDVAEIVHRVDAAASGKHFAWLREPGLDPRTDRRDERGVVDLRLQPIRRGLCGVDRRRGLHHLHLGAIELGAARQHLGVVELRLLLADGALAHQLLGACVILGRVVVGGLLHPNLRQRDVAAVLRLLDLCLRLAQLRLQRGGVHPSHDLAGLDRIALIDQHVLDAPRILGRDVDLFRLEAAVAARETWRQRRLPQQEPSPGATDDEDDCNDDNDNLSRHWADPL